MDTTEPRSASDADLRWFRGPRPERHAHVTMPPEPVRIVVQWYVLGSALPLLVGGVMAGIGLAHGGVYHLYTAAGALFVAMGVTGIVLGLLVRRGSLGALRFLTLPRQESALHDVWPGAGWMRLRARLLDSRSIAWFEAVEAERIARASADDQGVPAS